MTIFHTENAESGARFFKKKNLKGGFIYSFDDADGKRALGEAGLVEVPLLSLSPDDRLSIGREYIESIAGLSVKYASIAWWANGLSEKNEHMSTLYPDICMCLRIMKTLDESRYAGVLLIVCGRGVREFIDGISTEGVNGVPVEGKVAFRIKKYSLRLLGLLKALYVSCGFMLRKSRIPRSFRRRIRHRLSFYEPSYIIRTWLDSRFLKAKDPAREDAYFGRLPQEALGRGERVLMIAGIQRNYGAIVAKASQCEKVLIIPEEYFIRWSDLLKAARILLFERVETTGRVSVKGFDFKPLYESVLKNSAVSGGTLRNLLRYYIALRLGREIPARTFIHTYENYAWEKMWVAGLKKGSPGSRVLGFQHAFISKSSFKYFLGKGEGKLAPLPDRIITLGDATNRFLEFHGGYLAGTFVAGCALRQEHVTVSAAAARRKSGRVLVPLTMAQKESALIIDFLSASGLPASGLDVVIRPHPASGSAGIGEDLSTRMPENFSVGGSLGPREAIEKADIVLYTWSTLAIEALSAGLLAIHLDITGHMQTDPLFDCDGLKKTVSRPDELMPAIDGYYSMDESEYSLEAARAREYCAEYFRPVTRQNIEVFFNA